MAVALLFFLNGNQMSADLYHLLKTIHLIAMISWMAGMLYLPRLFVYHCAAISGGELDKTLQVMERRLLRYIINPAMIVTLLAGIALISIVGMENLGKWFHIKMTLLVLMFVAHGMMARCRKQFERGTNTRSALFYRVLNEVPTVLMIAIVALAVFKPL